MDYIQVEASLAGEDPLANVAPGRRWYDFLILIFAVGVFVVLAKNSARVPFAMNLRWVAVMVLAMLGSLVGCGYLLWTRTRFS
jgi:hypothetical protein